MADRLFRDRSEAGRVLAGLLEHYRGRRDVVVLGLPRGEVPVAYEVATALGAPLDVSLVRKLGAPGHEEVAMGAIASGGTLVLNEDVVRGLGVRPEVAQRAIGVIDRPETERQSHYFRARVADQFDAVIHVDDTRAVEPLERTAAWERGEVPETYPFAV